MDIFVQDDVYLDYQKIIVKTPLMEIKDFSDKYIRRDVIDIILAQQALVLGGFKHSFRLLHGKVNYRNTRLLQSGQLLLSLDSYWLSDAKAIEEHVFITQPVIRKGEYFAGIYTSPKNMKVLQITSFEDFGKLTSVSTPNWRTDWNTLSSLNLSKLVREDDWLSMARMVHMQWIDFMLMPFRKGDSADFKLDVIHLTPIPNVAIELKGSRHYVISKQHPLGEEAFVAIELGLSKLREQGIIEQAYREGGLIIDKTKVKVLNP